MFNSTLTLNSTHKIDTDRVRLLTVTIGMLVVSIVIVILNVCCLTILAMDKKIKQKRFEMLTMCLSISDAAIGIISVTSRSRSLYLRSSGENVPHFCYFIEILLIATFLFSLLQTLWICIERYIATFPSLTNPCQKVSIIGMTVALYVLCFVLVLIYFLLYGNFWSTACNIQGILGQNRKHFLRIYQSTKLIIVIAIILTYSGVIFRVYRSWRRIQPLLGNTTLGRRQSRVFSISMTTAQTALSTQNQDANSQGHSSTNQRSVDKSKNKIRKTVKIAITLGLIILILLIATLPKVFVGLLVMNEPILTPEHLVAIQVVDISIYINPLLDPVIYVIRINSFRERFKFNLF